MELTAVNVALGHCGSQFPTILCGCQQGILAVFHKVGVDKVDVIPVFDVPEQRIILFEQQAIPADMGNLVARREFALHGNDLAAEQAQTLVDTAKNEGIKIIALSGVLTLAVDSMKDTIEAFKAAGIRDDVKIIVGGAPVTETVCASVGADEWALSPQKTVSVCQAWAS